jgi:hypothetical protein
MIKRKTSKYALVQCKLGSNHYIQCLKTEKKSPVFRQSSELWQNIRYPKLVKAKQFDLIAEYVLESEEVDWMIVKRKLNG